MHHPTFCLSYFLETGPRAVPLSCEEGEDVCVCVVVTTGVAPVPQIGKTLAPASGRVKWPLLGSPSQILTVVRERQQLPGRCLSLGCPDSEKLCSELTESTRNVHHLGVPGHSQAALGLMMPGKWGEGPWSLPLGLCSIAMGPSLSCPRCHGASAAGSPPPTRIWRPQPWLGASQSPASMQYTRLQSSEVPQEVTGRGVKKADVHASRLCPEFALVDDFSSVLCLPR